MAAAVDQLTDSELRKQLKSYGQDVGPITKTTRRLWEKKLEKFQLSGPPDKKEEELKGKTTRRRSSISRQSTATRAASPSRRKSTAKSKKLAPFSSDEDEPQVPLSTSRRSIQTSPIGFPEKQESIPTNKTPLSVLAEKNSVTSRRKSSQRTYTLTDSSSNSYQSTTRSSEFSDDDFPESKLKQSKRQSLPSNGGHESLITSVSRRRNSVDRLSMPRKYVSESGATPTRNSLNESKIRDEIDASLLQIRNTFSAKKPSPPSYRAVRHTSNEVNYEDQEDEEDEELDAEFVHENYERFFNTKTLVIFILGCLMALLMIGLYLNDDQDSLPAITHVSGI